MRPTTRARGAGEPTTDRSSRKSVAAVSEVPTLALALLANQLQLKCNLRSFVVSSNPRPRICRRGAKRRVAEETALGTTEEALREYLTVRGLIPSGMPRGDWYRERRATGCACGTGGRQPSPSLRFRLAAGPTTSAGPSARGEKAQ